MTRFVMWDLPIHRYSKDFIIGLSDKELVNLINKGDDELDLLRELLWRAHRYDPDWVSMAEGKDVIRELQDAAKTLGQVLTYWEV